MEARRQPHERMLFRSDDGVRGNAAARRVRGEPRFTIMVELLNLSERGRKLVRESRGVSAFTLKIAAIVGMTCNHVANVFGAMLPGWAMVALYALGGLTFPIMAYLLCEGYRHTSNVRRYAERLAAFAIVSQVPFSLLFGATGNVLVTLLIGLGLLWAMDRVASLPLRVLAILGGVAASSLCDWGIIGPLMILLFWHWHDRPRGAALVMAVAALTLGLPALSWALSAPSPLSIGAVGYYTVGFGLSTALILCYNGQRGRPMKWFFYAYYPAHLMALWLLAAA